MQFVNHGLVPRRSLITRGIPSKVGIRHDGVAVGLRQLPCVRIVLPQRRWPIRTPDHKLVLVIHRGAADVDGPVSAALCEEWIPCLGPTIECPRHRDTTSKGGPYPEGDARIEWSGSHERSR